MTSKDTDFVLSKDVPKGFKELTEFFQRRNDVLLNNPERFTFQDVPPWEDEEHLEEQRQRKEIMKNVKPGEPAPQFEITNPMFDWSNKITPEWYAERFGNGLPSFYYEIMSALDNNDLHNYLGLTEKQLKNWRKKQDKKIEKKKNPSMTNKKTGSKSNKKKAKGSKSSFTKTHGKFLMSFN